MNIAILCVYFWTYIQNLEFYILGKIIDKLWVGDTFFLYTFLYRQVFALWYNTHNFLKKCLLFLEIKLK